ncbi:MAG: right-handed parallel beta-helix repeat-containing protein [Desulfobacterales bacterium]|nr:right-handed parallel beta-helix repeat-containing protein [Desulfobacterales bacterium]
MFRQDVKLPYTPVFAPHSIQAAINNLTPDRSWKEKVVCKGKFTISAPLLLPSYTILDLSKAVITLADASDCDMIRNAEIVAGNTQIEVIGGILGGNGANQGALILRGINLIKVSSLSLDSVQVNNVGKDGTASVGIMADQCTNGVIGNCTVKDASNYGISLWRSRHMRVSHGYAENNGRAVGGHQYAVTGDVTEQTADVTLDGNIAVLKQNTQNGFQCYHSRRIVIDGNVVLGDPAGLDGIRMGDCYHMIVSANLLYNLTAGMGVKDATAGYNPAKYVKIVDNIIDTAGYGVYVAGENVKVGGNQVLNTTDDGIAIAPTATLVSVKGNIVFEAGKHGIVINANSVIVNGNHVVNSADDVAGRDGIRLEVVSDCVVTGNRCYDTQEPKTQNYGIREYTGSDYNIITGNNLRGNLTGGLLVVGANTLYRTVTDLDPLNVV